MHQVHRSAPTACHAQCHACRMHHVHRFAPTVCHEQCHECQMHPMHRSARRVCRAPCLACHRGLHRPWCMSGGMLPRTCWRTTPLCKLQMPSSPSRKWVIPRLELRPPTPLVNHQPVVLHPVALIGVRSGSVWWDPVPDDRCQTRPSGYVVSPKSRTSVYHRAGVRVEGWSSHPTARRSRWTHGVYPRGCTHPAGPWSYDYIRALTYSQQVMYGNGSPCSTLPCSPPLVNHQPVYIKRGGTDWSLGWTRLVTQTHSLRRAPSRGLVVARAPQKGGSAPGPCPG